MAVQIDTTGLDRLLNGVIDRALNAGANAGADNTVELAKSTVPVGVDVPPHVHTRDTIRQVNAGQGVREVEAGGAGVFIELGTSRMPARPFLLPAATDDSTLKAVIEAVKAGIS